MAELLIMNRTQPKVDDPITSFTLNQHINTHPASGWNTLKGSMELKVCPWLSSATNAWITSAVSPLKNENDQNMALLGINNRKD